jgi:hypothetical protein
LQHDLGEHFRQCRSDSAREIQSGSMHTSVVCPSFTYSVVGNMMPAC